MTKPRQLTGGHDPPGPAADARYTVLGELARGGLGRVFAATDDALGRQVAIKQPLRGSAEALMRFEREAKLTARLQHAGVVPVYDLGRWGDGEPFFVMKMVEGRSLAELIRQADTPSARLLLLPRVLAVADTMAYAHSRGVIHRDLKPANVIINQYGETVVIDWGLARVLSPETADLIADDLPDAGAAGEADHGDLAAGLTGTGRVLGTPQFMPPEQAAGVVVDARADVYALGAILYNVLTGEQPYPGDSKTEVLDRVRSRPPAPVIERARQVPEDLAALVETAMAREPGQRYPTARELAQDLRRFLEGQLVSAHRYSLSQLGARWLRRHRAAVTVAVVLLAALVAAGVLAVRRVVSERNGALAARQAALARENTLVLFQAQRSLPNEPTAALAWLKRYRPTPDQAWVARALSEEALAQGVARHVFRFGQPAAAVAVSMTLPRMAVGGAAGKVLVYDLETGRQTSIGQHPRRVVALEFGPGGDLLASLDEGGQLRLWSDRQVLRQIELSPSPSPSTSTLGMLAFSPSGARLVVSQGERQVAVLGTGDLAQRARFDMPARISDLTFCPSLPSEQAGDRAALVVADMAGNLAVHRPGEAAPRLLAGKHADVRLGCLPGGRQLVSAGIDGRVLLWDLDRGLVRQLQRHDDWVSALAVAPDGSVVASGSGDDTIILHRLGDGHQLRLRGHQDSVRGVVFSADGHSLASLGIDASLRLWDVRSGQLLRSTRASRARTQRLWLGSGGRHLVSSGPEEALVWPIDSARSRLLQGHGDLLVAEEWSASSKHFVTGSRDRTVRLWDVNRGESRVFGPFDSWPTTVHFLGEHRLFVGTRMGTALLVDVPSGRTTPIPVDRVDPIGNQGPRLVLSPDRRRLAYASRSRVLIQPLEGQGRVQLEQPLAAVSDINWSGDGERLAVTTRDGLAGLWRTDSGQQLERHQLQESALEVSLTPDDRWAAVLTGENRIWLWDLRAGQLAPVAGERVSGAMLSASQDSRRFIWRGLDMTVRLLNIGTRQIQVLRAHRAPLVDVVRPPTSALLASSDVSGLVRLWNLETGDSAVLLSQAGAVDGMEASPDGRWLATAVADAGIRLWDMSTVKLRPVPTGDLPWLEAHTTAVVDGNNELRTP
jgi:eukaryotic-like serine/threonine-protein kinase